MMNRVELQSVSDLAAAARRALILLDTLNRGEDATAVQLRNALAVTEQIMQPKKQPKKGNGQTMTIEVNSKFQAAGTVFGSAEGAVLSITPPIDAEYFIARVPLFQDQAIQIFPKFMTVGCGFAQEEEDWNTNLPLGCDAEHIYDHIACNKKYSEITRERCLEAIRMLQAWARAQELIPPEGK